MGRLWVSIKYGRLDHPVWDEAESQYMAKYEGKTEVDLTEKLSDLLNLAILRYPDGNVPNEEWPEFIDYYLDLLISFLRMDMKLDEKLVQPLQEINALLYDLETGRRNVHIPQGAGTGKDSWEKSMLMGRVSALVTIYRKYGGNKTVESACRRAARLLKAAHIVFDSGDPEQKLWKYIKSYRKDILREKRDPHAVITYWVYTEKIQYDDGAVIDGRHRPRTARELIEMIEQDITEEFGGRDLRPGAPIP